MPSDLPCLTPLPNRVLISSLEWTLQEALSADEIAATTLALSTRNSTHAPRGP